MVGIIGVALDWGSLPVAAVCVVLRFRPAAESSASSCAGSPLAPQPPWPG
ncbi:MAG TPA: hypothetical protein VFA46_08605 [Actinomycetes bacterium]|nr:hypothetical protein [Actinomycetes bacterium]